MRSAPRNAARSLLALTLLSGMSCGGSSGDGPTASSSHSITVTASLYNATVDNPVLEAALLIDGVQVGTSTKYAGGTGNAGLSILPTPVSAGSHKVALRVIQQRFASVTYTVIGAVIGANGSGALVQQNFPSTATLKAGEQVEVTVNVP